MLPIPHYNLYRLLYQTGKRPWIWALWRKTRSISQGPVEVCVWWWVGMGRIRCCLYYLGAQSYKKGTYYGQGSGEILLDDVVCTETESSLLHCQHPGVHNHNCRHSKDIGIKCASMKLCVLIIVSWVIALDIFMYFMYKQNCIATSGIYKYTATLPLSLLPV